MMGNNLGKLCILLAAEGKLPADKPKQISRHSKAKSTVKPCYKRGLLQTEEDPRTDAIKCALVTPSSSLGGGVNRSSTLRRSILITGHIFHRNGRG